LGASWASWWPSRGRRSAGKEGNKTKQRNHKKRKKMQARNDPKRDTHGAHLSGVSRKITQKTKKAKTLKNKKKLQLNEAKRVPSTIPSGGERDRPC
jgi:hypothetical protein